MTQGSCLNILTDSTGPWKGGGSLGADISQSAPDALARAEAGRGLSPRPVSHPQIQPQAQGLAVFL